MSDILLKSLRGDNLSYLLETSLIAGLAVTSAVLFAYNPVLVFAFVLAITIAFLLAYRPAIALKIILLTGGIPLEWLGATNPDEKPLMRAFGGTSVDGVRLVILSAVFILILLKSGRFHIPRELRWYLVFVGFLALTLTYSSARLDGLRLVVKMIYPVLIFFVTIRFLRKPKQMDSALNYWITGGVIATVIGILMYTFRGPSAFMWGDDLRYSSGLIKASPFSMYMMALFFICYAAWRTTGKHRYVPLVFLFGLQAMIAQTRITWGALLVGLLVLELSIQRKSGKLLRAPLAVGALALILGCLVWSSPQLQHRFFSNEFDPRASALDLIQNLNLSGREAVWGIVYVDYLSHSPWLGQGPGTSEAFLRDYDPFGSGVPHNEYLRLLHDTGLIGVSLFLIGLGGLFRFHFVLRRWVVSPRQSMFSATALALLVGYVIEAITDNPLDYYLLFSQYVFFTLGLAMNAAHDEMQNANDPPGA